MKMLLLFLPLALLGQSAGKEGALGRHLRKEILRGSKPISVPLVQAYLNDLAQKLTAGIEVELVNIPAADPVPLPGNKILMPAGFIVKSNSEVDLVQALAHAIGHIRLNHGFKSGSIYIHGWSGMHMDSLRPDHAPAGFLKLRQQRESEADRFALRLIVEKGSTMLNHQAFQAARAVVEAQLKP